jgi:tetratricopeptide (TPR) repeat protein
LNEAVHKHLQRGAQLIDLGKSDLAERELRLAAADDPQNSRAHCLLALCLLAQAEASGEEPGKSFDHRRQVVEARAEAERAIGLAPEDAMAFRTLARALLYLDQDRQAAAAADESLRLAPQEAWGYNIRAILWQKRKMLAKAMSTAELGLQHDPSNVGCLATRISVLISMERYRNARKALEEAMATHPDRPEFHRLMGQLNLFAGHPAAAAPHLQESLQRDPMDKAAQHNYELANRIHREGNWEYLGKGRYRKRVAAAVGGGGLVLWLIIAVIRMIVAAGTSSTPQYNYPTYSPPARNVDLPDLRKALAPPDSNSMPQAPVWPPRPAGGTPSGR